MNTATLSPDSIDVLVQNSTTRVWSFDTDNGDHVATSFDWLDRPVSSTDQRGVIHQYSYDSAGRLSADTVSDLGLMGQNVDGAIRRIGYSYDDLGRQEKVTSYSDTSGTTVANQVQYAYDGWGNLIEEWQAHDGAVNTSTTESVQYVYDDGASGGVAKYLRLTDVVYPNGRHVVYGYGSSGSTDYVLSRIATIGDGTNTHAAYEYLGLNMIVSEDYEQPEIKLDYAAGNFASVDRFGRILDQVWSFYGGTPGTRDEYNYTYDRAGNRTTRVNALESALSQLYDYDDLDQLLSADRANGYTQDWELDGLGNWSSFDDDGTVQTRGVNAANEITSASGIATPTYDRAGNMVSTPKPASPANSWTVKYDAWNRVVQVTDGTTTVTYEYDATGRRIVRDDGTDQQHFFYDDQQLIETRVPDGMGGLETESQYVWSLRYIDAPVLRDMYSGGVLQTADRIYYLSDDNHNITAITDIAGDVQERYDYDAYGKVTIYDDSWSNPTTTSAAGNMLFFAGQVLDQDTGLQYSRARWYSSVVGGFISRDPLELVAGDFNLYRYVGSNPVIYVDPSGLMSFAANVATGAASGGLYGAMSGSIMGGGATMGGIVGGIFGAVSGALQSPKATFGEVAAWAALEGILAAATLGGAGAVTATSGAKAAASSSKAAASHGAKLVGGGLCFAAGTLVSTADGLKAIEEIRVGERIWSCDLTSGDWRLCRVEETFAFDHAGDLIEVFVAGQEIESTYHHPYWVVEGQDLHGRPIPDHVASAEVPNAIVPGRWVDAGDLRVGDVLLLRDGRRLPIQEILVRQVRQRVYNFRVHALQTYAVGPDCVLVHNNCAASQPGSIIKITQKGLTHVSERHVPGGAKTAGKSLFNAGEDVVELIKAAEAVKPVGSFNRLKRVVDAGRNIGTSRTTGPTSVYTVITEVLGDLVTAFPGV